MSDDLSVLDFLAERKRPAERVELEVTRELGEGDLRELQTPAPVRATPAQSPLDRIKEVHHIQARLLAEGKSLRQVAAIVGSSIARLRTLELDPTFQELIEYYRDQVTIKWLDVHEKLALGTAAAVEELLQRLEEHPETFTNNQLRMLVETFGDRSIAPSKVGVQIGNVGGQTFTINFAKPAGAEEKAPVVIEGRADGDA